MISIIIPNYNKAKFIKETLDSVLNQTYPDWECVIVDDHSTDNSWEILEFYSKKDFRIKIFKRPEIRKKGVSTSRNYAIELAKGEFVAFLDSDDSWNPNRLEKSINFINSKEVSAIFSGAIVFRKSFSEKLSSRNICIGESVFDFVLSDNVFCPTPSLILKRELALSVMFDDNLIRHEDYDFFIRVHEINPWTYFENFDVRVNWNRDDLKVINYLECIPFYEKHWKKSLNKEIRYKYILRLTSSSIRESFKYNVSKYFRSILESEGYKFSFKNYIMFYYPRQFYILSKSKWFFLKLWD